MQELRKYCKYLVKGFGVLWLMRLLNRRKVRILQFHGVFDDTKTHQWQPLRTQLSVSDLRRYLSLLGKKYRFVSLHEAHAMLTSNNRVSPNCIAVSFDDGYENNVSVAMPVLEELGISATIFVVTARMDDSRPFFWDRLDFNVQRMLDRKESIEVNGKQFKQNTAGRAGRRKLYKEIGAWLRNSTNSDAEMKAAADDANQRFENAIGHSLMSFPEPDQYTGILDRKTVQTTVGNTLNYGSHTVDHVRLATMPYGDVEQQLVDSKIAIEEATGQPCRFLAYPDGSVNDQIVLAARSANYDCAVTTNEGLNAQGIEPLLLKRIHLGSDLSAIDIEWLVSGMSTMLATMRGLFRKNQTT